MNEAKATLSRKEAATYLGVHVSTIDRWAKAGILPSFKPPGMRRVLYKKELLDKAMMETTQ